MGIENGARPAAALPAPVGRPHEAGRDRRRSTSGRRRRSSARCSACTAGARGRAERWSKSSCHDGTSLLNVTFFNQAWREKQLAVGTEAAFFGKLDVYRGKRQMTNPVVDVIGRAGDRREDGRDRADLPAVGQGRGVHVAVARARVGDALRAVRDARASPTRSTRNCSTRTTSSTATRATARSTGPTRWPSWPRRSERLIFDEFLRMQVGLVARKRALAAEQSGHPCTTSTAPLVARVPRATAVPAHRRPGARDRRDHARHGERRRRCTGCCRATSARARRSSRSPRCSSAVQGGYQGAFMAPTEVLAEQHYLGSVRLLDGLTVARDGFVARGAAGAGRAAHQPHDRGRAAPHRGGPRRRRGRHPRRHARVALRRRGRSRGLGVAVIDEQHRFGVEQRALLRGQGPTSPTCLVMTATPIPRTAAMLVYGDLDKSELREMPPGRTPITTKVVGPSPLEHAAAWKRAARRGRGRSSGVRGVPARRGEGEDRGQGRDRGVRAAAGGGARRPAARVAARPDAVEGEGGGDGRVPQPRASTCWSRRR